MEQIYKANGLNDYLIKTEENLLKVHGIALEEVKGYKNLTEENKQLYKDWVIIYMNRQGLDRRIGIRPTATYFCEEVHFDHVEEHDGERWAESVKTEYWEICANGKKRKFKTTKGEDKEINSQYISKPYLRVELKEHKDKEWYHVWGLDNWG